MLQGCLFHATFLPNTKTTCCGTSLYRRFYLNAFPWPDGVSQDLSPTTIVEGFILNFNLHFWVIFGEYA